MTRQGTNHSLTDDQDNSRKTHSRSIANYCSVLVFLLFATPTMADLSGIQLEGVDSFGNVVLSSSLGSLNGIRGSGLRDSNDSDTLGIRGSGLRGIRGSGLRGIRGSGLRGIRGSGLRGIRGSGLRADAAVQEFSAGKGIPLLALGPVDFWDSTEGVVYVLGQSVVVLNDTRILVPADLTLESEDASILSEGRRIAVAGDLLDGAMAASVIVVLTSDNALGNQDLVYLRGRKQASESGEQEFLVGGVDVDYQNTLFDTSAYDAEPGSLVEIAGFRYSVTGPVYADGASVLGIRGSGLRGIRGSGLRDSDDGDTLGIRGSGLRGIRGSGLRDSDDSDTLGIRGSGLRGIRGSGLRDSDDSDTLGIRGSGLR